MMSNQPAQDSSVTSNGIGILIYQFFHFILPGLNMPQDDFLIRYMPLIRKMAHFTEFAILGLLSSVVYLDIFKRHNIKHITLFGFIYACSDEIHQLFVLNRYCSFKDVTIDSLGVFAAVLFCHLIYIKWIKKES